MFEDILFFLCKFLIFLSTVFFLFLLLRNIMQRKYMRELRHVKIDQNACVPYPKISLIIPVCNEAHTISDAANTLLSMCYDDLELIFVNDRSTDGTDCILKKLAEANPQIKVLNITQLPKGWLGKVHACHQGMQIASGDWILFSDADVHYGKLALKKAIVHVQKNQLDFLSVIPGVTGKSLITKVLLGQILHYFTLYTNFSRINDRTYPVAAHGAFLLVKKEAYLMSRGFEWIKMEILDDVGFATEMKYSGAKVDTLYGKEEVEFEWYKSISEVIKGFEKNLFAGFEYSWTNVIGINILLILIFLSYTLLPLFVNIQYSIILWSAILAFVISSQMVIKCIINLPKLSIFLFPLTILFLPLITLRSAIICHRNKGILWRGTHYSLDNLISGQRLKLLKNKRNSD